MSKSEKIKEFIGLLKSAFGVTIAIILTLTAGLINLYYKNTFDILFYLGFILDLIFLISLPLLLKAIIKKINELEGL